MTDPHFSAQGKPATDFERDLLARSQALEDPWVEIASIIGLDAALAVMDRFASCLLSVPSRAAFVGRLHRVWLDDEVLRLHRAHKTTREVAEVLGITLRSARKRRLRAMRRQPTKRA